MRELATGSGEPARLLLVEHEPRAALLIGEMLRASWTEGVVFAHATGVADACQELRDRGATCVLLDVSHPSVAPLECIEQIRTAAPEAAIIALGDRPDDELAMDAIRLGAQDFLLKPDLFPALLARAVSFAIERKRSEVALAHQALHDSLTGLPNRALFLDRLGVALDRSRRTNASVAVLFLDVDNFKQVNDTMGHATGDRLLAALGERLRSMLRPMDTIARFGGDEFTFLFEDLASEREVVLIAERINRAASAPLRLEDGNVSTTVSIGIAMVTDPTIPAETVIREADAAMYRAKELGRSRYELYDEATRQRATDRLELESELRTAVDRDELRVHYQPKFSLDGDAGVVGFEALVRWEHPERGLIGPREFLPLAEETGMDVPIGAYVLEQALRQSSRWRRWKPDVTVSINLSPRQLEDTRLPSILSAAMEATGTPPATVCLEISERAVARNPEVAIRTLHGLKGVGVRLAIDDYGTGSSLLSSLKRLPVDVLKIHESFVSALDGDPAEAPIVGAVVELGHALGMRVVAEGVETDAQLRQLRALGVDGAQGFLFGPAVPEDQADELLAAR